MARRLFNGNAFSENGWPYVDDGSCTWIVVPGTNPDVNLQIQNGVPLRVMAAFAADINAYVEHVTDPDSACWTLGNKVATSNHPGGTAMDIDWKRHPYEGRGSFNAEQLKTIQELLDFYEGMIFWAGVDWSEGGWGSPIDEMHWQMGYNTYDKARDQPFPKCQDFINRKIRADGFSTFRRSQTPPLSRADRYALLIIAEGQRRNITPRGIQIALATGLVESNLTIYANAKVPASMDIPHDAVGSDGYSVGIFQQQVRDTGNGWWWGDAATCMDPTTSAGLFYDRLAKLDYNGPNSPGSYAQAVQQSAFPDRYDQRFSEAVALYNRLAGTPTGDDELSAQAEQMIADIHRELTQRLPSRSPLRHLGEGTVDTLAGMLLNTDSSVHVQIVKLLASLGHPESLALLREVAAADPNRYPDRQADKLIAQAILADLNQPHTPAPAAPVFVAPQLPAVVEPAHTNGSAKSTGDVIGNLYTALEEMHLADALPIEARAPLAALIAVLQTKNGSQV